ncbi:hypothetical protein Nepgr_024739 [Nepenthes gracilis]|uniref:Uncharacterized protein n=1 Tax=Nepenthes gracilis TaxID=150966 RepID=A0AAD3T6H5_NEPGR|nr:hypothetical protein Nepgr_024739 [Nepenthes gracilis]
MNRLHHARICIEVGKDDPLPDKIRLLTSANESDKIVDVKIVYRCKPAHRNSQLLNNKKWVSKSLIQQPNCPQPPAYGSKSHFGLVVHPFDRLLDAKVLEEARSTHVIHSSNGMGHVHCTTADDPESKPAEAEVGLNDTLVVVGGASHCPVDDGGTTPGLEANWPECLLWLERLFEAGVPFEVGVPLAHYGRSGFRVGVWYAASYAAVIANKQLTLKLDVL